MTILEGINGLAEPYRSQAIENREQLGSDDNEVDNLSQALLGAFLWHDSPEGNDYWSKYNERLIKLGL